MRTQLAEIEQAALREAKTLATLREVEQLKVKYLGKKGLVTGILRGMGQLSPEERPLVGQLANRVKKGIESALDELAGKLAQKELDEKLLKEKIDITLPPRLIKLGKKHILSQVREEIEDVLIEMGFAIAEGPEVELDYYNFKSLNFPDEHPARDMQDTFYLQDDVLLRTHTSSVQIRTMEKLKPPVKIISPGKVYRCDYDNTHSPMFMQVEGLYVDKGVTFAQLKGVLNLFYRKIFGEEVKTRFRPSFFPFTEPSAEVDVSCVICRGEGCRVCQGTGWLEIMGAGMVDPNVFDFVGYDSEEYSGFAFGLGVDRVAMLKYGIDNIRLLYENDLRFLRQF